MRGVRRALLWVMMLAAASNVAAQTASPAPIAFEENRGVADRKILFFSRGKDYSLSLSSGEATLTRGDGASLGMHVDRTIARTSVIGLDPLPGTIYYARGSQLIEARTYRRVKYSGIYNGIDLEYYGRDRQLEFDFVVRPHADPRQIRLSFTGAQQIILGDDGDLRLRLANDEVILRRPIIYQVRNGIREAVSGGYVISRSNRHQVRFAIGSYDRDLPLVIDPTISYATYLGSPDDDRLVSIETNAAGELYVFGATSNRFEFPAPLTGVTYVGRASSSNSEYCFLSKFDTSGSNLIYSVIYLDTAEILGPAHCDAMTVSPAGTPYTVYQSIDGSFTKTLRTIFDSGGTIASPTKLLTSLEGFLPAPAIKVDADGYVYVIGGCFNRRIQSPNPYPLPNGFRPNPNAGKCTSPDNFFSIGPSESILAKYDVDGNLIYGSFLAGSADDASAGRALAMRPLGTVYVGGHTMSTDTPHTGEAFQLACADSPCDDGFVEEIDTTMSGPSSLRAATFIGGVGPDAVSSIALGIDGSVTIAGETASVGFPTENGPVDATRGAAFVTRLAPGAASQVVFTRLITTDSAFSGMPPELKLLGDGAIAIVGVTEDSSFPLVQPLEGLSPSPGFPLPFLTVFSPNATTRRVSTTLAGPSSEPHLAVRGYDEVYAAVRTAFGGQSTPGAFQTWVAGGADLLLIKISGVAPPNADPIVTSPVRVSGYQANIVNATSLAGALVPLTALVKDPDGDPLTVRFAGLHDERVATMIDVGNGQFQADTALALPLGRSDVTMTVSDGRGGVVTRTAQITVLGAATTATSGTDTVSPIPMLDRTFAFLDPSYQPLLKVTLGNIRGAGVTTVNVRTNGIPPLPGGYQLGSPPYYYDVTSTVPADGPFTFCVDIEGMSFADSNLRMFFHDGVGWSDITTAAGAHEVCGQSPALGTYAVLHAASAANTATTIAGSGYYPGAIDGPGGDPRDDFIDGQLPTLSALSLGRGGVAIDRTRNVLYTTTLTQIRRVDLNSGGTLDTIGGDGLVGDYLIDPDDGTYGIVPTNNVDARSTHITNPNQLALDSHGNLYIAEFCQIRRIDTSNVITTVAGDGFCRDRGDGGPANLASIDVSPGVAIDRDGQIIILEQSGRIRRVRSDGVIDTIGFIPQDWLDLGFSPVRMAVAGNGDFYIVGGMEFLVRRSAADGRFSVINRCALTVCTPSRFGGDGRAVSDAQFQRLLSVAVHANGDLLVGDSVDHRIRRISAGADGVVTGEAADEIISTVTGYNHAGTPGSFHAYLAQENYGLSSAVSTPWDIAIDPTGGFIFANGFIDQARRVGASATMTQSADLAVAINAPANGETVHAGVPVTYAVVMSNLGPSSTATIARLRVTLPDGLEFGSGSIAGSTCSLNAGVVVCDVDSLAAGANAQASVVVTPRAFGSFTVSVEVSSSTEDPDRTNNAATVTVTSALIVDEQIHINDAVSPPQPAIMIPIAEVVHVLDDVPAPQPAISIPLTENIHVADDVPPPKAAISLQVDETIRVFDASGITDTTPPLVTPPASITIASTEASGARGNVLTSDASRLRDFLVGASAVDDIDPAPARQTPQAQTFGELVDATDSTLFPIAVTTVTFSFRDAAGNIGSASSTVTVLPPIGGQVNVAGVPVQVTTVDGQPLPITITFADVVRPGLVTATPMSPFPPLPQGFTGVTLVFDIVSTAFTNSAATVCFQGPFSTTDRLFHFQNSTWVDVTTSASATEVCGQVGLFSPFVVLRITNRAPTATASAASRMEATSPSGAAVTLTGSGSDPDSGDTLSFKWTEGTATLGSAPTIITTLSIGGHNITLTVTDSHMATATAAVHVDVVDTRPPVLALPGNLTVNATGPLGAVVTYTASANDLVDLSRPVNCTPASGMTFAIGTTDVKCSTSDTRGNTATGSFKVAIKGAADQIKELITLVKSYGLSSGLTSNLVSKLQSALDLVNTGKSGACGKMKDFIDTVNAQTGKGITQTQAAALIASATRIKAVLGCP